MHRILLILLTLIANYSSVAENDVSNQDINKPEKIDEGSIKSDDWITHRDIELGFEIKYPREVDDISSKKKNKVPVKFFKKNNAVYIAKEYFYMSDCKKIPNTFNLLEQNNPKSWKLIFRDIHNEEDLDQFVKEIYGSRCKLGGKEPAQQDGVFNISTYYDGKGLGESDCFINYMSVMKYYPKNKKAVSWDIGQEGIFWNRDIRDGDFLDYEMVKSFRFLN